MHSVPEKFLFKVHSWIHLSQVDSNQLMDSFESIQIESTQVNSSQTFFQILGHNVDLAVFSLKYT